MSYEFFGDLRPYHHQESIIRFLLTNKRGYVFADMGTGKTLSCLWFSDMLLSARHIKKVLIIAPLSTLNVVWADEIKKSMPYRKYSIVHGTRAERVKALQSDSKFFITNTDAVRNYEREILALKPDVIIIDEVTSFANASSARSKAMQRISKCVPSIYGLSGNPTAGGLIQSYGIAKAIRPEGLPNRYFTRYREMILQQINLYEYIPREGAIKIVNKTLSPAIKFSLEECIDLPPITWQTRFVELPKKTMVLFKEMLKHQIAEYKSGLITASTAGVKSIRLMQILTGFTKTDDGVLIDTDITPKLKELLSIYHESGNKLVIFCQSVRTTEILRDFFREQGLHAERIFGGTPLKHRERIIQEFQVRDEGIIVAQVKTMSHGITLTKSHTIVFFGTVAGNETYRQAIRRIRRIGQTHRQTIILLVSTKFETKVFEKLDRNEMTSQAVLSMYDGGVSEFL